MNKKLLIVVLVFIVSTISFGRSFLGLIGVIPWHYGYSDVFNEDRINLDLAKKIPYLERPIEYQFVVGIFVYFMWFLGKNLIGYVVYSWIFLTAITIVTALQLYELSNLLDIDKKRFYWFFVFAPSLIFFGIYNWDILAVMFTVIAIKFFCRKQYSFAALFLSLGFNTKFFPIFILPIMLLKIDVKQGIKMVLIFLLTFFVLNSYFIVNSFDVWKFTFTFQGSRDPNIDSYWHLVGLRTSTVNILSFAFIMLSYLLLIFYHKGYDIISLSISAILIFLVFNKIFSPQYILWLLPFFVLVQSVKIKAFYMLEAANLAVFFTGLFRTLDLKENLLPISTAFAIARTLILVYLILCIVDIKNKFIIQSIMQSFKL